MPSPTTIASAGSSGTFQDAFGILLANGKLTFDLSQSAAVTGGGEIVPKRVTVTLDSTAKPTSGQVIWRNTDLTPSGTTYRMQAFDSGGNFAGDFGSVSLTGSPIDLTILIPVSSGGVSIPGVVLLNPAAPQVISGQTLSLSGALLGFEASGTTPDTGISRTAAATLAIGNGTQGDVSGTLKAAVSLLSDGSAALPSSAYISEPGTGFSRPLSGIEAWSSNGARRAAFTTAEFRMGNNGPIGWSSFADPLSGAPDTGLSRATTNTVAVGNGSQGDTSGTLKATTLMGLSSSSGTGSALIAQANTNTNVTWNIPNGAADQKLWDLLANSTVFNGRAVNDAVNSANSWITVNRGSGFTIGAITFGAGGGVQTLFTGTDTIMGKATTDIITNKTVGAGGLAGLNENKQVFSGSGTFTIPAGVVSVKVTIVAGGGGGGAASINGTWCGGGGGGGWAIKWLTGLTPANTITVTVGIGGTSGNAGGNSSISSGSQTITTVTAVGGLQVNANGVPGATNGGTSTNGDVNGGASAGGTAITAVQSGTGGASIFGGGGAGITTTGVNGTAAVNPGSGGGGSASGGAAQTGGSGAAGIIIFEWVS